MTCGNYVKFEVSVHHGSFSAGDVVGGVRGVYGAFHVKAPEMSRRNRICMAHKAGLCSLALSRKHLLTPGVKDIKESLLLRPHV